MRFTIGMYSYIIMYLLSEHTRYRNNFYTRVSLSEHVPIPSTNRSIYWNNHFFPIMNRTRYRNSFNKTLVNIGLPKYLHRSLVGRRVSNVERERGILNFVPRSSVIRKKEALLSKMGRCQRGVHCGTACLKKSRGKWQISYCKFLIYFFLTLFYNNYSMF